MFWILAVTVHVSTILAHDCEPPPVIDQAGNNATHDPSFPEGTQILYFCNLVTYGTGYPVFTCIRGQWTNHHGDDFICRWKTCNWPEIEHGTFDAPSLTVGNTATFTCDEGYKIRGTNRAICRIDMEWRGVPTCERVTCPEPGYIPHMERWQNTRGKAPNTYGNLLENTCEGSYRLIGPEEQKCENNGQWTWPDPYCEEINCGTPDIGSGHVYYDNTDVDAVAIVECFDNATLAGEDLMFCSEQGWTYAYCHGSCDARNIEHGKTTHKLVRHGDKLNWECNGDFVKTVNEVVLCQNGEWSTEPTCGEIEFNTDESCPTPYKSESGYYVTRYRNTCYIFINLHVDFELANKVCRYNYRNLVTIDNEDEAEFVARATEKVWTDKSWLGIKWVNGAWRKSGDTGVGYTNWQSGQGGTFMGYKFQKCAVMEHKGTQTWPWDDVYCTIAARVICEADPEF